VSTATTESFAELLLAALDAQLEQQGRLAAISEAQTSALATRDVEQVDALTRALESAVLEGPALEQRRAGAAADLATALGVDPAGATISTLLKIMPAPLASLLSRRQEALLSSIQRLRRASAVNRALIEGELATIDHVMRATRRTERISYSDNGAHDERLRALLDARA
jgi:hypothetical protein